MREPTAHTIHLKDYTPPAFLISTVELDVETRDNDAFVRARLSIVRNPEAADPAASLVLNGGELTLQSIALDGRKLAPEAYCAEAERLTVHQVPDAFKLETAVT